MQSILQLGFVGWIMRLMDLTGMKFGLLTVLGRSERRNKVGAMWDCRCECGGSSVVESMKLRTGRTKSCGCQQYAKLSNLSHGMANKSTTYRTWKEMRQRCMNPNSDKWQWYGGRGISVCERWNDFESFLEDMGDRPDGRTLDRIDSDGSYCKENCRWATPKEQATTNRGTFKPGVIPHNKAKRE